MFFLLHHVVKILLDAILHRNAYCDATVTIVLDLARTLEIDIIGMRRREGDLKYEDGFAILHRLRALYRMSVTA